MFCIKKKRQDDVLFGHYSLSSHFLHRKANQVIYFAGVFNVSNLHQIWQNSPDITICPNMVLTGSLKPQRTWHQPKETNSGSLELSNLTVHDAYFELTVGILSS